MSLPTPSPSPARIGRGAYCAIGVVLFAIKHNLDRAIASFVFGKPWGLFNYLIPPEHGSRLFALSFAEQRFYGTLLLVALPFVVIGVTLTLRRLRDAGLPQSLVLLFFVPVINVIFFIVLSVVPSRTERRDSAPVQVRLLDRLMPESQLGSALAAVLVSGILGVLAATLGAVVLEQYGWGLFVGLPFATGLFAALLHGYHAPRTLRRCLAVATLSSLLLGGLLLVFAAEGVICLVMAGVIAVPLAAFGGFVGYVLQLRPAPRASSAALLVLVALSAPLLMGAERASPLEAPLFAVTTVIEVAAPPEVVWEHVVAFADLPPPEEWLFRLGIAYPVRATIDGRGPGAVRHCVFSTGPFEEPIVVWDAPRRLSFLVTAQPAPMQEWTPYRDVHPAHLEGYLRSERGEFRLVALAGGRTRLEGTTWYRHHMWPASYWRLWSDAIIHRIHERVLRHIRTEAETAGL